MPFAKPDPQTLAAPQNQELFSDAEWSTLPVRKHGREGFSSRMPKHLIQGLGRRMPAAGPTQRPIVSVRSSQPVIDPVIPRKSKITLFTPSPMHKVNLVKSSTPIPPRNVAVYSATTMPDIPEAAPASLTPLYQMLIDASYHSPLDAAPADPRIKVRMNDIARTAAVARDRLSSKCNPDDFGSDVEMIVM